MRKRKRKKRLWRKPKKRPQFKSLPQKRRRKTLQKVKSLLKRRRKRLLKRKKPSSNMKRRLLNLKQKSQSLKRNLRSRRK